jgi:hypothetical protein
MTTTLTHIKIDAYGPDRDTAIAAVRAALTHLLSGINSGHAQTRQGGHFTVQYDDGAPA